LFCFVLVDVNCWCVWNQTPAQGPRGKCRLRWP
jgi:hypothetical protein